eukprot:GHVU01142017.1.p2 GENE.GHVU01142017.1~~GHVU01142017.1.p2  ORF type:complete len:123 (-),score=22.61 GHVU01142017.1:2372-2740(-)
MDRFILPSSRGGRSVSREWGGGGGGGGGNCIYIVEPLLPSSLVEREGGREGGRGAGGRDGDEGHAPTQPTLSSSVGGRVPHREGGSSSPTLPTEAANPTATRTAPAAASDGSRSKRWQQQHR